jgi:hypothetical protein
MTILLAEAATTWPDVAMYALIVLMMVCFFTGKWPWQRGE